MYLSISKVTLDTASSNYTDGADVATSVEECLCPPQYTGLSCEECADGYYRSSTGSFGGFCVPCQCNNHADTCDKVTGVCIVSFFQYLTNEYTIFHFFIFGEIY